MFNKKMKKFAAVFLSASMIMAAGAVAGNAADTEEKAEEKSVTLAIADAGDEEETPEETAEEKEASDKKDQAEEKTEAETQAETETETETEPPVVYETLETTKTGAEGISAIDVSDIVENTMPSIVSITGVSVQEVESYFYGKQEIEMEGGGSGIIIAQNDDELLIATNNHVVEGTKELTVCFTVDSEDPDNLLAPAVIKGTSGRYDLAVIAVKLGDIKEEVFKQLKIATLGSSDNLQVGETAIVIGNALGIGQTVTAGIISALEREITTEAGTFTELQTDAAVNFGCSGGAILNAKGEVIGITSAKATDEYAESMGYGIPIGTAIPVLQELINRETRDTVEKHGYLGITVVPVSEEAKQMYNMPAGAFVYEVSEGSAAEEAGIKKGDIITRFDGREIDSSDALVDTLGYYAVGETVTVELQVSDNGEYTAKEVEVTLQKGAEDDKEEDEEDKQDDKDEKDEEKSGEKEDSQMDDPVPFEEEYKDYGDYYPEDDYYGGYDYSNPFDSWNDYFGQFFFGNGME